MHPLDLYPMQVPDLHPLTRAAGPKAWMDDVRHHISSGEQMLETVTNEPQAVYETILAIAVKLGQPLLTWDVARGFTSDNVVQAALDREVARLMRDPVTDPARLAFNPAEGQGLGDPTGLRDPLAALKATELFQFGPADVARRPDATPRQPGNIMFCFFNYIGYFADDLLRQTAENMYRAMLFNHVGRRRVVHMVQANRDPAELRCVIPVRHMMLSVPFALPAEDELLADTIALIEEDAAAIDLPPIDDEVRRGLAAALRGLDRTSAARLLRFEAARRGRLDATVVAGVRRRAAAAIAQAGTMRLVPDDELVDPSQLGGVGLLMQDLEDAADTFSDEAKAMAMDPALGVVFCGLPGCLHGDTPIFDPTDGTTRSVADRKVDGVDFHVWAVDEAGNDVIAKAWPPCRFVPAEMVTLTLDSGDAFTVTPKHRLWGGDDFTPVDEILRRLESGPVPLPTSSAASRQASPTDARRRREGCIVACVPAGTHPYYDFHVPTYNNYWACGCWHHNTGKSASAKAIPSIFSARTGRSWTLVELRVGAFYGSLQGQMEQAWYDFERREEALGDRIIFLDEFDQFAGVGNADGVDEARKGLFKLITAWAGRPAKGGGRFLVYAMNDPTGLPPEATREGRVDETYFFDLPRADARAEIFKIHVRRRMEAMGLSLADLDDTYKGRGDPWARLAEATPNWLPGEIEGVVKRARRLAFRSRRAGVPTMHELLELIDRKSPSIDAVKKADKMKALIDACKDAQRVDFLAEVEVPPPRPGVRRHAGLADNN